MNRAIVIVEDNPSDSALLKMALARTDPTIESLVLQDGSQAIEFFSSHAKALSWDLILLDLNLPRVSGFEVLEFLKTHPQLKGTPVVILSGSSSHQDVERCYAAGANSYLCKPAGLDAFFNMIDQLVGYWFDQAQLPSLAVSAVK